MKINFIIIVLVFLFLITSKEVFAHPGNTASDGCHYCRTNCDKWGVAWNVRHCHNGGSTPKPYKPTATSKPTVLATSRPSTKPSYTPLPSSNSNSTSSDDGGSSIGWLLAGGAGVYGYQWLKGKK
jgi:hypothetical protein